MMSVIDHIGKKSVFAVCSLVSILILFLFSLTRAPSRSQIDRYLRQYETADSFQTRVNIVMAMLEEVGSWEAAGYGSDMTTYAYSVLQEEYQKTQDEAILEAIDQHEAHGAMRHKEFGFYYHFRDDPELKQRYQNNLRAREELLQCVGKYYLDLFVEPEE